MSTVEVLWPLGFFVFGLVMLSVGVYLGHRFTRVNRQLKDIEARINRDLDVEDGVDMATDDDGPLP